MCNGDFSFMGWANHVKKEKRLNGDDIYLKLKVNRTFPRLTNKCDSAPNKNRKFDEFK